MALHFIERGNPSAETIVFIHGGVGLSSWMWEKQLEYFRDYHCLVPDLPEHGKSIREGRVSIEGCAAQIAEIIERNANGGKAYVIGYSFGAKVIIELLRIRPQLVSRGVVASALIRPVPIMRLSNSPGVFRLIIYALKSRTIKMLLLRYLNFPDRSYRDNCIKELRELSSSKLFRIFNDFCRNLSLPEGLKGVSVPTLVIAGQNESEAMKRSVVDIANAMSNAKGILIRNGSHTYPWSMHKTFDAIVEEWIKKGQITNQNAIPL